MASNKQLWVKTLKTKNNLNTWYTQTHLNSEKFCWYIILSTLDCQQKVDKLPVQLQRASLGSCLKPGKAQETRRKYCLGPKRISHINHQKQLSRLFRWPKRANLSHAWSHL